MYRTTKNQFIKFLRNQKEGDGCYCHINPPCGFCTSEKNSIIQELIEGVQRRFFEDDIDTKKI